MDERRGAAEKAGWNVFQFPSEMLMGGDLLSDSGTTTLTSEQLAAMILGDEAYGTNWGYLKLIEAMEDVFGISTNEWEIFLFHQGRAAEHALFSQLGKLVPEGSVIPSNGHFDTTRANIEANGMEALDLESKMGFHSPPFYGDIDFAALSKLLSTRSESVPCIYTTITNNRGGGYPVSLLNMEQTASISHRFGKSFFLDACRFAENAWFIKHHTFSPSAADPTFKGFKHYSIKEIIHRIFRLCDGFTISFKKDGLSNIGGALVVKKKSPLTESYPKLFEAIRDHQILTEGHPTYGGMAGRDLMVIAEGLRTVVIEEYLASRIGQVYAFGKYMAELGIPILETFGGSAVYIDTDSFFKDTSMKSEDFGGISLTALLLLKGVRLCELGAFAFGKWNSERQCERFIGKNFVRCAVPRNKYELDDLRYVADCVKGLYDKRDLIPRAVSVYGRELSLRHFKARFELKEIK